MNARRAVPALLALALVLPSGGPGAVRADGAPRLPGLTSPVRVVTDRFGIPHVRAASLPDLYCAWGWVTARDRLWQLVYARAAGRGLLHRWFGNDVLQGDGGAQLFELRERAARIWARDRNDPALRSAVGRYTDGINAYLAECRSGARPWPQELVALGERPGDWSPEDCVLVLLGLGVTLDLDLPELRAARQIREHGREWFFRRHRFESRWIYDTIPDSVAIPSALRAPRGAVGIVTLPPATALAASRAAEHWPAREGDGADRASNEMVVGAARSASGRPLLANDPHLMLTAPGPFHVIHLSVPGVLEAAGAAVPGLPAVVSGRSPRVAWGVTALGADAIDVYADSLSADGRHVKGPAGWTPVVTKPYALSFRVLGVPLPALGQVRHYTPHGPVVVWDAKHRLALSVRWAAMEDARITLASLVGLERARTADELVTRVRTLVTPEINAVAADVDGDARYQAAGLVPVRGWGDPPLVEPGDGHHEWEGFVPPEAMPAWRVPAAGFAVNGNNRPSAAPPEVLWGGYDFAQDRAARMAQRLAGDPRITLADLASVQNDVVSRASARQLPALLAAVSAQAESLPPAARAALDSLRGWDFAMRRSRVAPTLARSWWNAYLRRSQFEGLPGLALAALTGEAAGELRSPAGAPESPGDAARAALGMALDSLRTRLGPRMGDWTWGRAHRARFTHALAANGRGARFAPALQPADGDGSTVSVGGTRAPWNFEFTHGPAFRHVVDLADRSRSWCVVPPWNSTAAGARGADLSARWAEHAYVPLWLDWAGVERDAAESVELRPAGR